MSRDPITVVDGLLDPPTLARYLRISESTVKFWRTAGGGPPFIRVGRHVRYRWDDVEAWLHSHRRPLD